MILRYTVSLHRVGNHFSRVSPAVGSVGDHLDWFFQIDAGRDTPLATFSTTLSEFNGAPIGSTRLVDHRSRYLEFTGEISGDRGHVQPLITGFYQPIANASQRFDFRVISAAAVLPTHSVAPAGTVTATRITLMKWVNQLEHQACFVPFDQRYAG